MPKLATNVLLRDPDSGAPVVLLSGREVPDWAERAITNPAAWEGDGDTPKPEPEQPSDETSTGNGDKPKPKRTRRTTTK